MILFWNERIFRYCSKYLWKWFYKNYYIHNSPWKIEFLVDFSTFVIVPITWGQRRSYKFSEGEFLNGRKNLERFWDFLFKKIKKLKFLKNSCHIDNTLCNYLEINLLWRIETTSSQKTHNYVFCRGVTRGTTLGARAPPPLEIKIRYKFLIFFYFQNRNINFLQKNVQDFKIGLNV